MAAVFCLAFGTPAAFAGPPYVTDDPEPTDTGHWEVYGFGTGTELRGVMSGQTGFDINYGAAKDLQITLRAYADFDAGKSLDVGTGDVELGVKYRFIHQAEGSWAPDVALFPSVSLLATSPRFGGGQTEFFLPLWMQKDFGPWSLFGGGGYQINPGLGNRNFWLTGWAATRQINDKLQLGAEIYHQTPSTASGRSLTGLGFGLTYQFAKHLAFITSGGPSIEGQPQTLVYTAIKLTY